MARRVALGKLSSSKYGLRVSKPGKNAVDTSSSTLVDYFDLLFDSTSAIEGTLEVHHTVSNLSVASGFSTSSSSFSALSSPPVVFYRYYFSGSSTQYSGFFTKQRSTGAFDNNNSVGYVFTTSNITFINTSASSTAYVSAIIFKRVN